MTPPASPLKRALTAPRRSVTYGPQSGTDLRTGDDQALAVGVGRLSERGAGLGGDGPESHHRRRVPRSGAGLRAAAAGPGLRRAGPGLGGRDLESDARRGGEMSIVPLPGIAISRYDLTELGEPTVDQLQVRVA